MKVTNGSLVKLRGTLRNDLYVLEGTTVLGSATTTSEQQMMEKKHQRNMQWKTRIMNYSICI